MTIYYNEFWFSAALFGVFVVLGGFIMFVARRFSRKRKS